MQSKGNVTACVLITHTRDLPAGDEAEDEEDEEQGGEEEERAVCRDKRSEAAKCGKNRAATRPRFLERAVKCYGRC